MSPQNPGAAATATRVNETAPTTKKDRISMPNDTTRPFGARVMYARPSSTGLVTGSATVIRPIPDAYMVEAEDEATGEILLLRHEDIIRELGKFEAVGAPGDLDAAIGCALSAAMTAAGMAVGTLAAETRTDPERMVALLSGRTPWQLSGVAIAARVIGVDVGDIVTAAYGRAQ